MNFIQHFLVVSYMFMSFSSEVIAQQDKGELKSALSGSRFFYHQLDKEFIQELTDYVWEDKLFNVSFKYPLPCPKKINLVIQPKDFWEKYDIYQQANAQADLEADILKKYTYIFAGEEIKKNAAIKLQAKARGIIARKLIAHQDEKIFWKICNFRLISEIKRSEKKIFDSEKLIQSLESGNVAISESQPKCIDYAMIDNLKETRLNNKAIMMHVPYFVSNLKKTTYEYSPVDLLHRYEYCSQEKSRDKFLRTVVCEKINENAAIKLQARARGNIARQVIADQGLKKFLFIDKQRLFNKNKRIKKIISIKQEYIANEKKYIELIKASINKNKKRLQDLEGSRTIAMAQECFRSECKNKHILQKKINSSSKKYDATEIIDVCSDVIKKYDMEFIQNLNDAITRNVNIEISDPKRKIYSTLICCPSCALIAYKDQKEVKPRRDFLVSFALRELIKVRLAAKIIHEEFNA